MKNLILCFWWCFVCHKAKYIQSLKWEADLNMWSLNRVNLYFFFKKIILMFIKTQLVASKEEALLHLYFK